MVSGLDRYFQIAPCFRDEDARADRSPTEFYQIDLEMAFATQEDVFAVIEGLYRAIFKEFKGIDIGEKFTRIKYTDSMRDYCSDKPDQSSRRYRYFRKYRVRSIQGQNRQGDKSGNGS